MVVAGRVSLVVSQGGIECKIQLKNREVLEIFLDTIYWKDFFHKTLSTHSFGAALDPSHVSFWAVNLA